MAGENMKNRLKQFISTFFGARLDFRVRLFNVLAMGGTVISLAMALVGIAVETGLGNIIANFISAVLSFWLLCYSQRTGRYQLCYMITIVAIFLVAGIHRTTEQFKQMATVSGKLHQWVGGVVL